MDFNSFVISFSRLAPMRASGMRSALDTFIPLALIPAGYNIGRFEDAVAFLQNDTALSQCLILLPRMKCYFLISGSGCSSRSASGWKTPSVSQYPAED